MLIDGPAISRGENTHRKCNRNTLQIHLNYTRSMLEIAWKYIANMLVRGAEMPLCRAVGCDRQKLIAVFRAECRWHLRCDTRHSLDRCRPSSRLGWLGAVVRSKSVRLAAVATPCADPRPINRALKELSRSPSPYGDYVITLARQETKE